MPSDSPLVSAIIPYYNGSAFVAAAIQSVLAQTHDNVEVIVVDDGSAAGDTDAFAPFRADPRVAVLVHDANRGIAAARNTGLRNAHGDFIGFLDQDDVWRPDKIAAQIQCFRSSDDTMGVVLSDVVEEDDNSGQRWRAIMNIPANIEQLDADALLASILKGHMVALGSALIRRRCIDRAGYFDESIRGGADDFDYSIRLAQCCRFACVREPLLVRLIHGANFTAARRMVPEALVVVDRLVSLRPGLERPARVARSRLLYHVAREHHVSGSRRFALQTYFRSFAADPTNGKPALAMFLCALGPIGDALLLRVNRATDRKRRV